MTRAHFFWVTLAALAGLVAAPAASDAAQGKKKKPNIVVIVADDLGYGDIGVHGCKDVPTPHIDSLAKHGVRCTSGYVSGPYCSPTRAGLMTGRYQQRFGHEFNTGPATDANIDIGLTLSEVTIAQLLQAQGYRTAMVGKWHLGHAAKFNPVNRGFQDYFGFLGGAHPYIAMAKGHKGIFRGLKEVEEKEYLTDAFDREALAFLDKHGKEPFFLYLAYNAVHGPLQATDKYLNRFPNIQDQKRKTYAGMLSAMDDSIGKVLAKLRDLNLEEDTLIFFISDNGGPPVNASNNGPLRGYKATTWEGGIRVPFLIQWKGMLPANKTYDHPVIQLDILPTCLAACNADVKHKNKLDGVNLLPHLLDKKTAAPHAALYWRFGAQMAIRMGDWTLVKANEKKADGAKGPNPKQGKLSLEGAMLFNLKEDLGQKTDLAAKNAAKVKELTAAWEQWNGELVAPAWGAPKAAKKKATP
jgi:arylsulfatase A-like enzyme